jgi:hypothetical protein
MEGRIIHEFWTGDTEELRSEDRKWRKWVSLFRNSAPEQSYQLGVSFFCSFSSFLNTLLLLMISAQYKWRQPGFYHLRISVKGRWSFPLCRIR